MSETRRILDAMTSLDFTEWTGLPVDLTLEDLAIVLSVEVGSVRREQAGDPSMTRDCVSAELQPFEHGVRVWLDEGRVVLLEARLPLGPDAEPLSAPEVGDAEAYDDAMVGTIWVEGAERVYASRGLALRAHPETGRLAAVLAFAPTSVESYRRQLRPVQHPIRRLAGGGAG